MEADPLTYEILNSAYAVHSALGPGLLESSYKACLHYELRQKGLFVEREKPLPLVYREITLECGYRIDLLVENRVIVELKTVAFIEDVHVAQVLTYMKLTGISVGLLINFYSKSLKDGIRRFKL